MSDAETGVDESANTPMTGESLEALRSDVVAKAVAQLREFIAQTVRPDIDDLQSTATDHQQRIEDLEATVEELRDDLEFVAAVAAADQPDPTQRAIILASRIQTAARARADDDTPGRVSWDYNAVKDQLAGEGVDVYDAQAYDAMDDVAEACTGVRLTTNDDGVKVLRANSAALSGTRPVNEINNAGPEAPGETDHDNTTTVGAR